MREVRNVETQMANTDNGKDRFPFCIVWTPLPLLTWFFPIIGHIGIALSSGVIHSFVESYSVIEDDIVFGQPTKYWQLSPTKARGGVPGWDQAIKQASDLYKGKVHSLFNENCHSHVVTALNLMHYNNSESWTPVKLAVLTAFHSKHITWAYFLKTWLPFLTIVATITSLTLTI